mgnify:CR=1 FL=1
MPTTSTRRRTSTRCAEGFRSPTRIAGRGFTRSVAPFASTSRTAATSCSPARRSAGAIATPCRAAVPPAPSASSTCRARTSRSTGVCAPARRAFHARVALDESARRARATRRDGRSSSTSHRRFPRSSTRSCSRFVGPDAEYRHFDALATEIASASVSLILHEIALLYLLEVRGIPDGDHDGLAPGTTQGDLLLGAIDLGHRRGDHHRLGVHTGRPLAERRGIQAPARGDAPDSPRPAS